MQFTANQNTFKKALTLVKKAMPTRSTLPILESVRLVADGNGVLIEGTNLDVAMQVRVDADVDMPGEAWVRGKTLLDLLKGKDPVMVHLEANKVYMAKEGLTTTMPAQDGTEWPPIAEIEAKGSIDLKDAMTQCAGFMSCEDTRHFLNGVYIEGGKTATIAATDGRMLKAVRVRSERSIGKCELIIPTSAVKILTSKDFPDGLWDIGYTENQVVFKSGDVTLVTRRIDGDYPDYKAVVGAVNKDFGITTSRTALIEAVAAVASVIPVTNKRPKCGVTLELNDDQLSISAEFEDLKSNKAIDADGAHGVKIYINPAMLHTALSSMDNDGVTLFWDGKLEPISIESEADEDTILMPMRGDD